MDNETKKNPTYADLAMIYFVDGLDALREKAEEFETSRVTMVKVVGKIKELNKDATPVETLLEEMYGPKGTRGMRAPVIGDVRTYKAQQAKNQGVFTRTPLETLGVSKGGSVHTCFCEDERGPYLIVRPGPAPSIAGNDED